jgi:hypothetical protein
MKAEVGQNFYQSIHFYKLSGRQEIVHAHGVLGGQKITLACKTVIGGQRQLLP